MSNKRNDQNWFFITQFLIVVLPLNLVMVYLAALAYSLEEYASAFFIGCLPVLVIPTLIYFVLADIKRSATNENA